MKLTLTNPPRPMTDVRRISTRLCAIVMAAVLAACASPSHKAPVEERGTPARPSVLPGPAAAASAAQVPAEPLTPPLPGAENLGKPGYYVVKPGDTLIRIGLDNGQNWRDITRWNGLDNPNQIEVGQVIRVIPPTADSQAVAVARPVAPSGRVDNKPLEAVAAAGAASAPPAVSTDPDENVSWAWPAAGPVASGFDESRSKGLAISGKAGDPVLAAADGRVVYAGSGLRGYGNLVIVKHNTTYLTAYAHNQTLLVKEDQAVRRGQKIAEMGASDADSVQLHFEIRRQGKPIDPARLLPPR